MKNSEKIKYELNCWQLKAIENYEGGEFIGIVNLNQLDECGDGLLTFIVREIGDVTNDATWGTPDEDIAIEVSRALGACLRQVESVRNALYLGDFDFHDNRITSLENATKTVGGNSNKGIVEWLDSMGVQNYTINEQGLVDVEGDVDLSERNLTELPVKFGEVTGYFYCNHNQLTSLKGAPQTVNGNFYCDNNQLTSLEGAPQTVGGYFYCGGNPDLSDDAAKGLYKDGRLQKKSAFKLK